MFCIFPANFCSISSIFCVLTVLMITVICGVSIVYFQWKWTLFCFQHVCVLTVLMILVIHAVCFVYNSSKDELWYWGTYRDGSMVWCFSPHHHCKWTSSSFFSLSFHVLFEMKAGNKPLVTYIQTLEPGKIADCFDYLLFCLLIHQWAFIHQVNK